jgi:hypothetical protein
MASDPVRLVVEINPGEPVSGSAAREGEAPVPFEGLLGFLALFERLRQRIDPSDAEGLPQTR